MIKRLIIFFGGFFAFWMVCCGFCLAAPVGNPAGAVLLDGNYPTKFSMEAETILERKLKSGSSGNPDFHGMLYTAKVSLYTGNKLDIYGLVGIFEGKLKHFIDESYIIDSKMDIAYGMGVSYVWYEKEWAHGILRLGTDAKIRQFNPGIDTVRFYREVITTTDNYLRFTEWQAALGLSYQYKKFVPYMGLKYSDMNARVKFTQDTVPHTDTTISSQDTIGLFYGADYLVSDTISVNIEGRSLDEKALNLGINARF